MLALTHLPSSKLQACERTFVAHEEIDYERALTQHAAYCDALRACRVRVVTLNVNADQPDSTFIEDIAVVLDEVAVLASMGTASRRDEPRAIEPIIREHREMVRIESPATLEGGDVLRVGRTLLVGTSCRTNHAGIALFAAIVERFGYRVMPIPIRECLHLKTACTVLPDGRLLINPAWINKSALTDFDLIEIPTDEPWAANVCLVNSNMLLPAAHARTANLIDSLGFAIRAVELSEFAKAEGGVTCLSLLINE
ncbi:MAG TPA: arginine deiminase family protein [Pirellulaceae bacterium]|jgi:dimethylargininase